MSEGGVTDFEANETFHAFRVGFTHGAGRRAMLSEYKGRPQNYQDYLRGWEHGRNVWTAAMEEERARIGLSKSVAASGEHAMSRPGKARGEWPISATYYVELRWPDGRQQVMPMDRYVALTGKEVAHTTARLLTHTQAEVALAQMAARSC